MRQLKNIFLILLLLTTTWSWQPSLSSAAQNTIYVETDPVDITPKIQYYQLDNGMFRVNYTNESGQQVHKDVPNAGTNQNPVPATTEMVDQIDMRNYPMGEFRDAEGKRYPLSQVQQVDIKLFEFVQGNNIKSFKGLYHYYDKNKPFIVQVRTLTGADFAPTDEAVFGKRYGTNYPKMNFEYNTPMKIQWKGVVIIEDEPDPTPPPSCKVVISDPRPGTNQSGEVLDPQATGVIKADWRDFEMFDVADGIPTSESLYANTLALEYLFKNSFTQMTGTVTYTVPVTKTYNLYWEVPYSCNCDEDGCDTCYSPMSDTVEVTKSYPIVRPYSYWNIMGLQVYGIQDADMNNYALPNNEKVMLYPKGYTPPTVNTWNSDKKEEHVFPASCGLVDLGSESIHGGTSRPPVPNEDGLFRQSADESIDKNKVRNDKVHFNGETIMNDAVVVQDGETPSKIPQPNMIDRNVLYEYNLTIPKHKVNKKDTPSHGDIRYNLIHQVKGGEPLLEYPINDINTVTVHTPVVMYADVSDDKEHNQRTNPDYDRRAIILDRPFTVTMPTEGQHRDIKGYGNRDYKKYYRTKQVRFPFDVFYKIDGTQKFVPANTWLDIPLEEVEPEFFMPVWSTDEGPYDVLFRAIAENAPPSFTTEPNANLDLQHHVATDVIPVDVIGRIYDFRVTDIADYMWRDVFRLRPWGNLPHGDPRHSKNYYWVGKRGIDGKFRGNDLPFVLPIMPGSHPEESKKKLAVKKGYHFKFDLKTKGNMFGENDGIRIKPRFYYVKSNGSYHQEVDLYYFDKKKMNFVKVGSEQDDLRRHLILNHRLRNVYGDHIANNMSYAFNHYDEYEEERKTTPIRKFLREYINYDSKVEEIDIGTYNELFLPWKARTMLNKGPLPDEATHDQERAIASEQQWFGEFSIPSDFLVVKKDFNIAEYGRRNHLSEKSPIFTQFNDGYIIVNFDIETIRDGDFDNPHLQYIHAPLRNQWRAEGYLEELNKEGQNKSPFPILPFIDGDVILYYVNKSSKDDFDSRVTH